MIRDLNKIFELWKDKVGSKRTPNPTNAEHQYQLREILKEFNWDNEVINELLYNLSEANEYLLSTCILFHLLTEHEVL